MSARLPPRNGPLLVSNFDENQIVGVEQKIKNEIEPEVKIEPMVFVDVNEENFN